MKMSGPVLALSAALLAGCSTAPAPDRAPPPPPNVDPAPADPCGAQAVESLTGQILDDETRIWLDDRSRASSVRVIEPGSAYTMDHRPDRLNVKVDDQRRVTEIACG